MRQTDRFGVPIVELAQGGSLSPRIGDGALDLGVDGFLVGDGDVHARVTFRLIAEGLTTLTVGSDTPGDALVLGGGLLASANGLAFDIHDGLVVGDPLVPNPEPTTALLLGLGLALLGSRRLP